MEVKEGLRLYEAWMLDEGHRNDGGNKSGSVEDTMYKIGCLLSDTDELLEAFTDPKHCQAAYDDLRKRPKPRTLIRCQMAALSRGLTQEIWKGHKMGEPLCLCQPYAADSHRQMLLETKTFLRWCVSQKYITTSGMEKVAGKGKRKAGKEQLRIDGARLWYDRAVHNVNIKGDLQSLACLCTITMGLSGTEITDRLVEDVDDNCTRLWITEAKTRAREKAVDIPEELQPYFRKLVEGRSPTANLWGEQHWRDWILRGVKRICREAGVKEVSGHGMRGLFGTMKVLGGEKELEATVETAMRHEAGSFKAVAGRHYVATDALSRTLQRAALGVLRGGKK